MKKEYNKLIRDKIPEIITVSGATSKTRTLNEANFKKALLEKIVEEAEEVKMTKGDRDELIKELGDVQEVIVAIKTLYKISDEEVSELQQKRKQSRGGFEQGIFLEYTEE